MAVDAKTRLTVPGLRRLRTLVFALLLSGCATPGLPPVADRSPEFGDKPSSYRVRSGDTLYSIAWRYRLDVDALARWNGLNHPFLLRVDQRLRLAQPPSSSGARPPATPRPPVRSTPRALPPAAWHWPVTAAAPLSRVRRSFDAEHPGITFTVTAGQGAVAASGGEVVYSGPGLGGFEQLIIVRHANALLSAYSFDGQRSVQEGARVKVGAALADIRSAGRRGSLLYFELRRHGSPIDPRRVIR